MDIPGQPKVMRCMLKQCAQNVSYSPLNPNIIAVPCSQYFGIVGSGQALILSITPTNTLQLMQSIQFPDTCFDTSFCELDSQIVVVSCGDGSIKLWNPTKPAQPLVGALIGHKGDVNSVQCGHIAKEQCLSGGNDGLINLWDLSTMKPTPIGCMSGHMGPVYTALWHPTHASIFGSCSSDKTFRVWDLRKQGAIKLIPAHTQEILGFDFNKYENIVATCSSDNSIKLWDLRSTTSHPLQILAGHQLPVKRVRFSPFSKHIIASCSLQALFNISDMSVRIWLLDGATPKLGNVFHHHTEFVTGIDFSLMDPKQVHSKVRQMASVSWDKTATIYNYDQNF